MADKVIRVVEPRLQLEHNKQEPHKVVVVGGSQITHITNNADSYSSVQAIWTFQPPSQETIMDRKVLLRCQMKVQFDRDPGFGVSCALRQMPLASIMQVCEMRINGETISSNPSDYIHALLRYNNDAKTRDEEFNTTASMPDQFNDYQDWDLDANPQQQGGSGRNPLAYYGEVSGELSRGGFQPISYDAGTFEVVYEITEPLFISPLLQMGEDEGLTNVNQLQFTIRWLPQLEYLMSAYTDGLQGPQTVSVSFNKAPELLTTYITADQNLEIPNEITLPYSQPVSYTRSQTIASKTTVKITGDNVRLSQVPAKMMLFCRKSRSNYAFSQSDTYAKIDKVQVQWNNKSNQLSGATSQQLHKISKTNGYNLGYSQRDYVGDVYMFEFGKDIGLDEDEAPGSMGNYNLQVSIDATNGDDHDNDYEFFVLLFLEGSISISPNKAIISTGDITRQEVLKAQESEALDYQEYEAKAQGGSFFSKFKNIVKKASKGVRKGAELAEKLGIPEAGLVKNLAQIAEKASGGVVVGGRRRYTSRRQ